MTQLEKLETFYSPYAWALHRVAARNIKTIVDRWGVEGLALERGQPCTDRFKSEITSLLSLIEGDTPEQVMSDDTLLEEYYKARGWDLYAGYQECTKRLVDCGLLESIEDGW